MAISSPSPSQTKKGPLQSNERPRSASRSKHRSGPYDEGQIPGQRRGIQHSGQLDQTRWQSLRGYGQTVDWHHGFPKKNRGWWRQGCMRKLERAVERLFQRLRSRGSAFVFSDVEISDLTVWGCCAAVEHLALLRPDQSRLARTRRVLDARIHEACIPGVGIICDCVAI